MEVNVQFWAVLGGFALVLTDGGNEKNRMMICVEESDMRRGNGGNEKNRMMICVEESKVLTKNPLVFTDFFNTVTSIET